MEQVQSGAAGAIPGVGRPVGLFRGQSQVDPPPERSHATVRRYGKVDCDHN